MTPEEWQQFEKQKWLARHPWAARVIVLAIFLGVLGAISFMFWDAFVHHHVWHMVLILIPSFIAARAGVGHVKRAS